MKIRAYMMAFTGRDGEPHKVREIEIPGEALTEHPLEDEQYPAAVLNAAFYYGQNDFQPRRCPSLSVGDVVEVPHPLWDRIDADVTYWQVQGCGFSYLGTEPPETPNGIEEVTA